MSDKQETDWVRADPRLRCLAIALVAALAIAGVLAFLALEQWLAGMQTSDPAAAIIAMKRALIWISVAMAVSIISFAAWFWLLGRRIIRSQRFPPPGMKVARDTPVVSGIPARRRGYLAQVFALVLVVCALSIFGYMNFRILAGS